MFLTRITLHNIKRYKAPITIDLQNRSLINTISGKNGSGKSTIFESILLVQKAFFADLLEPNGVLNLDFLANGQPTRRERVAREFAALASNREASISATFCFTKDDLARIGVGVSQDNNNVTLTLSGTNIIGTACEWTINTNTEEEKAILSYFWNLDNPTNIIVMLSADKNVYEDDFGYEKINLIAGKSKSPIIDFIMDSKNIYQHLYDLMMNAYLYERLNPQKPRNDDFIHTSIEMFSEIMDGVSISNFSGKQIENQFILLAKNSNDGLKSVRYDARNLSSGEKLIWYVLLVLNYIKSIGLLIVDEPENHLHEQLAWRFVLFLNNISAAENNGITIGQAFLITHAKSLIYNNFSLGSNYITDSQGLTLVNQEECESVLRNCGISFVEDKVIFVEGKTESENLTTLCNQHNIKIKVLGNCTQILQVYKDLLKVKELVTVPKFLFILDRDTREDNQIQSLRNEDQQYFDDHIMFLPVHEIENFLLDEEVIANVINVYLQDCSTIQASPQEIVQKMKQLADVSLNTTKKKYLNYELDYAVKALAKRVHQRDIVVSSRDDFASYVATILPQEIIDTFVADMTLKYDSMERKYNSANWDTHWKTLCDGKIVYNQTCSFLAETYSINLKMLKKKIFNAIVNNPLSSFSGFWNSVLEHLQ